MKHPNTYLGVVLDESNDVASNKIGIFFWIKDGDRDGRINNHAVLLIEHVLVHKGGTGLDEEPFLLQILCQFLLELVALDVLDGRLQYCLSDLAYVDL